MFILNKVSIGMHLKSAFWKIIYHRKRKMMETLGGLFVEIVSAVPLPLPTLMRYQALMKFMKRNGRPWTYWIALVYVQIRSHPKTNNLLFLSPCRFERKRKKYIRHRNTYIFTTLRTQRFLFEVAQQIR